jgi:hypothetical protein
VMAPGTRMSPLVIIMQDVGGTHTAAAAVGPWEAALRLHLGDELRRDVAAGLGDPALSARLSLAVGEHPPADVLHISHTIILTFVDETRIEPFVMLRAQLVDAAGGRVGGGSYFAATGAVRILAGDDGWLANGGAVLQASISASLTQAVKVVLADAHPYARDTTPLVTVHGYLPYESGHFTVVGNAFVEVEHYVALATRVFDPDLTSGVSIVDKSVFAVQPAASGAQTRADQSDTPRERAKAAKVARRDAARAAKRQRAAPAASEPEEAPIQAESDAASGAAPASSGGAAGQ